MMHLLREPPGPFVEGVAQGNPFDRLEAHRPIIVAEGLATATTIYEHTQWDKDCPNVVTAFDAGNIEPVVASLKERYPTTPIFIAADNDREKSINVGLETATRVSDKYGVGMIVPQFESGQKGSDFNDLGMGIASNKLWEEFSCIPTKEEAVALNMTSNDRIIKSRTGVSTVRDQVIEGIASGEEQSRQAALSLGKSLLGEKTTALNADAQIKLGANEFRGKVIAVTNLHVVLATAKNEVSIHAVKNLDRLPIIGRDLSIKYQPNSLGSDVGVVKPTCKSLAKDLQR